MAKNLTRIHQLLAMQSLVVILLSINRLTNLTLAYVAPNEFLRWVDFNNMLVLPLTSTAAFYLLKKEMEYESVGWNGRFHLTLNLTFIFGLYLLATSYGNHEVTNYLHTRFCLQESSSDLCRIVIFNDDEFSHWIFFLGFVLMNTAIMLYPLIFPYRGTTTRPDTILLMINGLFIGLGIFANLAFEEIGLDLVVVAVLALLAVGLLVRNGRQPLFIYYTTAYVFGLVSTFIVKGLMS